jgi:hypothetical protein
LLACSNGRLIILLFTLALAIEQQQQQRHGPGSKTRRTSKAKRQPKKQKGNQCSACTLNPSGMVSILLLPVSALTGLNKQVLFRMFFSLFFFFFFFFWVLSFRTLNRTLSDLVQLNTSSMELLL